MPPTNQTRKVSDSTEIGTDQPLPRLARIRRWLADNLWLLLGCFVVLMIVPSAAKDAETPEMREHRVRIEAMTQTERDLLLSNFETWRRLPRKDRDSIRKMHSAVAEDENLSRTLERFHTWLASVSSDSYEFRDKLLNEPDPLNRLRMIEIQLNHRSAPVSQPGDGNRGTTGSPADGPDVMAGLLRGPSLFGTDFEKVISVIARWSGAPDVPPERTPVAILTCHINVIKAAGEKLRTLRRTGKGPVRIPDELVQDILNAIANEERRQEILLTVGDDPQALVMLLLRSIRSEDIRRLAMTNAPMLEEYYQSIPAQRRLFVDRFSGKERIMRLAWMWVEEKIPGAFDTMGRNMRNNGQQRPVRRPFNQNFNRPQSR